MHCQLQEAVAPDGLSDHAIVVWIRRARGQDRGRVRKTGEWVEAAIQREIAVRSIEIGMVENVERVGLEFQGEALRKLEILDDRKIKAGLEWSAEDIAARAPVACFLGITHR